MAEARRTYILPKETLAEYLDTVVDEIYSKHPTELHISVDGSIDCIGEMTVSYKTHILKIEKENEDEVISE